MILVENLAKSFGERLIFSDVNFRINDGEKVGIVGKNGTGKSTLLKIIIGLEEPDEGSITGFRSEDLGYAEQIPSFKSNNLIDELTAIANVKEFEARKVLFGLGFNETDLIKNPNEFSGGETAKIGLAKALVSEPRILILDEPTNHLDIYAIDFLESFVKSYNGTVVAVTHDRHFLQNCVDKIIDIENKKAVQYNGNYEKFVKLKRERREYELKAYERQQEEIAKLEEFVRKYKAGVKAKQARGRQKMLDKIERLEKPPQQESVKLNLSELTETANKVLIVEDLHFKGIINNYNLEILKGEKIGLIGRNGTGKSTLLKLIVGDLKPDNGIIKIGNRVKIGYLSQGHEELDEDSTPIEELINEFGITIERARSELARLELYADVVTKPIESLSGGEKTRVSLAKLILTGANFLILDEPTNHLDLPAREAIESALNEFEGTILIVTHDRYLLEKVTTRVVELENRNDAQTAKIEEKAAPVKNSKSQEKPSKAEVKVKNKVPVEKLEAQIKMAEMELKMIEHEINNEVDGNKLKELAISHENKIKEIDELYEFWGNAQD